MTLRAFMGPALRCPACNRPQQNLELRSGDAWLLCWHRSCQATSWVVIVPAERPSANDVVRRVGLVLGEALLMLFAPAPLIAISVPSAIASGLRQAPHVELIRRLSERLRFEQAEEAEPPKTEEGAEA